MGCAPSSVDNANDDGNAPELNSKKASLVQGETPIKNIYQVPETDPLLKSKSKDQVSAGPLLNEAQETKSNSRPVSTSSKYHTRSLQVSAGSTKSLKSATSLTSDRNISIPGSVPINNVFSSNRDAASIWTKVKPYQNEEGKPHSSTSKSIRSLVSTPVRSPQNAEIPVEPEKTPLPPNISNPATPENTSERSADSDDAEEKILNEVRSINSPAKKDGSPQKIDLNVQKSPSDPNTQESQEGDSASLHSNKSSVSNATIIIESKEEKENANLIIKNENIVSENEKGLQESPEHPKNEIKESEKLKELKPLEENQKGTLPDDKEAQNKDLQNETKAEAEAEKKETPPVEGDNKESTLLIANDSNQKEEPASDGPDQNNVLEEAESVAIPRGSPETKMDNSPVKSKVSASSPSKQVSKTESERQDKEHGDAEESKGEKEDIQEKEPIVDDVKSEDLKTADKDGVEVSGVADADANRSESIDPNFGMLKEC